MNKPGKILVTGGTGLVGSHLLAGLVRDGKKVRAIYRNEEHLRHTRKVFSYYFDNHGKAFSQVEWIKADITDLYSLDKALQSIDTVYHAAGFVSFAGKDAEALRQINTTGTANMVNLSLHHGIRRFCHVSSIAVFGKHTDGTPVDEETPWNPELNNYDYAISKYGAEMEVWRGTQEGLSACIVNPGVIIGPGFWHKNTGVFFPLVHKGFTYYSEGINGFVGVWDVVRAMRMICENGISGERYILVSENLSFREMFTLIAGSLHVRPPYKKITPFKAGAAWRLATLYSALTGKPPLVTRHSAKAALEKHFYTAEKIKTRSGFTFEPVEQVIRKTSEWYLKDL